MATHNKTIIFPTDFSEVSLAALQWAKDIAATMDAKIECVFVVETPQIYSSLDMGASAIPTTGELEESAKGRMEKFVSENLGDAPAGASGSVVTGHAASEIVTIANDLNAAMIVMTTHGYSGMKHVLLGSTTEDVLRNAVCPVLSIRNN
jgi:nucleotide-binding universal stress UspA family protein